MSRPGKRSTKHHEAPRNAIRKMTNENYEKNATGLSLAVGLLEPSLRSLSSAIAFGFQDSRPTTILAAIARATDRINVVSNASSPSFRVLSPGQSGTEAEVRYLNLGTVQPSRRKPIATCSLEVCLRRRLCIESSFSICSQCWQPQPPHPGIRHTKKFTCNRAPRKDPRRQGRFRCLIPTASQKAVCPLKQTNVKAEISGFISRVAVTQEFENPFKEKIEAVYTFPLPQNAAVDDMTMVVGDRTVRGRVLRREEAQAVYEAAKTGGKVASLLDQERPNIFTQSVANIMPGEQIKITISYVETLKYEDGSYEFVFPMVVGPRYIPGARHGLAGKRWPGFLARY